MRPEEDKDIKVFHPSNEKKEQAEESTDLSQDILHAVQELDAQRSNGNLRRARKLGRSLAQFTPENAAKLGGIDIKGKRRSRPAGAAVKCASIRRACSCCSPRS